MVYQFKRNTKQTPSNKDVLIKVAEGEQIKFGKHWIQDWMSEYKVSLRKPNKCYSIIKGRPSG